MAISIRLATSAWWAKNPATSISTMSGVRHHAQYPQPAFDEAVGARRIFAFMMLVFFGMAISTPA